MGNTRRILDDLLANMPVVSVHEHHHTDDGYAYASLDRLLLNSYVGWINPFRGPIIDRGVFLDHVRHNSYFVWLQKGLQVIYGIEAITVDTWDAISDTLYQAHASDPTWHISILRNHARYRHAIQDADRDPGSAVGHPEVFSPAYRINCFVMCHHPVMRDHNGNSPWRQTAHPPADFDDYLALVEQAITERKAAGVVALKSALAYGASEKVTNSFIS